jgi:radical SAM protein with 4Fe4S-binding SPASM domain
LTAPDLSWAVSFWRGIKPYVLLRKEDLVLILPPNRVYKLNQTGYDLLAHLSDGGGLDALGLGEERAREVHLFFDTLRRVYDGEAVVTERVPYDFDFTRLPVLGEIALTYRCNQACRFCYAGCGAGAPAGPEMSARQVRRIIDIFKREAMIPFFSFTGGEPTLRPELPALVAYAKKRGLRVNLITNAVLATPELCAALRDAGLDSVQASLEAPLAPLHDSLTQVEGSHARALEGIANLMDSGLPVQTNTTLTALNAPAAATMPAFLASIGVKRFSMNLYIPGGDGAVKSLAAPELFLPYSGLGGIIEAVRKEAHRLGMTFHWYSPTPFCHYNPIGRGMGNKSCAAMDGLISVSPSGDVLPCSSYAVPMGNLFRRPFREVWFSERAAFFKQKRYAPAECSGCPSFQACQSACPLYWAYAGTAELAGRNPAAPCISAPMEAPTWK